MDLINQIRSDNAARDSDLFRRAQQDRVLASTLESLKTNLQQALQSLSDELYSKDSHFILELVQNADDNTYSEGVTPTLQIVLGHEELLITCNESGFTEREVRAICKIGASTKKHQQGYIGEKGIGFKSVFKVADKVFISSGPYQFFFDKNEELGMITPSWSDEYPSLEGSTQIRLQLSAEADRSRLVSYLNDVDPTLLLFLRKLRHLVITTPSTTVDIHRADLGPRVIALSFRRGLITTTTRYIIARHSVKPHPGEQKRLNITQSELVLAFPLAPDGSPQISDQFVHAFLPIRSYGFHFLLQGDFLTAANREDILSDSQWNVTLRDGVATAFLEAIPEFQSRPELALVWHRYIPYDIPFGFFHPVANSLILALKDMAIIRSADGQLRQPSRLIIPAKYLDERDQPLVPEAHVPRYYLSSEYDLSDPHFSIIRHLGINDMSDSDFLNGLVHMNRIIPDQPSSWLEAVATQLYPLRFSSQIRAIRMIPLQNGQWVSFSQDLIFNSVKAHIPQDLDLRSLISLSPTSSRYRLFSAMGVKETDPAMISKKVLELHGYKRVSPEHLLSHAHFLFTHRGDRGAPTRYELRRLYLLNQENVSTKALNLYMNHREQSIMPLSDIISSPALFLHDSYAHAPQDSSEDAWHKWLRDDVQVNVAPRVVNGRFSPEFDQYLSQASTNEVLRALRDYWPQLQSANSQAIEELANRDIVSFDGDKSRCKLSATALHRGTLSSFSHLLFLPVDNPEDDGWDFLGKFGVMLRPDGLLYLKWLQRLSLENSEDADTILSIYKQLEARFEDDKSMISEAFAQDRLVFIPARPLVKPRYKSRWLSLSDVVWSGPPSMRSKWAIKFLHPTLRSFFCDQLRVRDSPSDILLQEIIDVTSENRGSPISDEVHHRVTHILRDIVQFVQLCDSDKIPIPTWMSQLLPHSVFPVRTVTGQLVLRNLTEKFYIPDRTRTLYSLFRKDVDMLELESVMGVVSIEHLFETESFRSPIKSHYLDAAVSSESEVGQRVPDIELQEEYLMRSHLVIRMLRAAPRLKPHKVKELQMKFQNLVAFKTESLVYHYTLDGHTRTQVEDLTIKEESDHFVVLIKKTCSLTNKSLLFCERMAPRLDLDKITLSMIFTTSLDMATAFLDRDRIGQDWDPALEAMSDSSWVQDIAHARVETTETGWKTTRNSSIVHQQTSMGPSSTPTLEIADLIGLNMAMVSTAAEQQSSSFGHGTQALISDMELLSIGNKDLAQVAPSSSAQAPGNQSLEFIGLDSEERGLEHQSLLPRFHGEGAASLGRTQASPSQYVNGILGEYFIFKLLQNILPAFTVDNWTSELRGYIPDPEFTPYTTVAVADFQYRDMEGVLTGVIFGDDVRRRWQDHWPDYYLEVKTTSNEAATSFHMSSRQLQLASDYTMPPNGETPPTVYVLVRVSNIRSPNTSYKWCPDPHRSLFTKQMRILSDVELTLDYS